MKRDARSLYEVRLTLRPCLHIPRWLRAYARVLTERLAPCLASRRGRRACLLLQVLGVEEEASQVRIEQLNRPLYMRSWQGLTCLRLRRQQSRKPTTGWPCSCILTRTRTMRRALDNMVSCACESVSLQTYKVLSWLQGANERFQALQRVYAVLGDEDKYVDCDACG